MISIGRTRVMNKQKKRLLPCQFFSKDFLSSEYCGRGRWSTAGETEHAPPANAAANVTSVYNSTTYNSTDTHQIGMKIGY